LPHMGTHAFLLSGFGQVVRMHVGWLLGWTVRLPHLAAYHPGQPFPKAFQRVAA
jgi:hypothetical protein